MKIFKKALLLLIFASISPVISSAQILGFEYSHAIDEEEDLIPGSNKKGYHCREDIVYLTFTNKLLYFTVTDSEGQTGMGAKMYKCESYSDGWYKYEVWRGVFHNLFYLFNDDFTEMRMVTTYSNPKISYVYKREAPKGNKLQSDRSVKSRLDQVRDMLRQQQ